MIEAWFITTKQHCTQKKTFHYTNEISGFKVRQTKWLFASLAWVVEGAVGGVPSRVIKVIDLGLFNTFMTPNQSPRGRPQNREVLPCLVMFPYMLPQSILQIANLDPCGISFVSEYHKQITWLTYSHCDLFFLAVLFILSFSLPLLRKWIFLRTVMCPSWTERTGRLQVSVSGYAEAEIKTV